MVDCTKKIYCQIDEIKRDVFSKTHLHNRIVKVLRHGNGFLLSKGNGEIEYVDFFLSGIDRRELTLQYLHKIKKD